MPGCRIIARQAGTRHSSKSAGSKPGRISASSYHTYAARWFQLHIARPATDVPGEKLFRVAVPSGNPGIGPSAWSRSVAGSAILPACCFDREAVLALDIEPHASRRSSRDMPRQGQLQV